MIETLFGGLLGGVFRIIPEVLKWLDKAGERKHELAMLQAEMEFTRIKGEIMMRQTEAVMTVAEMDAITEATKEQGATARYAGKTVAAMSALVRPLITYWFVTLYSLVKIAMMVVAYEQGGDWKEVLIQSWTTEDMALLTMILTFWFVGRVWEKYSKQ
jgi:hypothetical protein